MKGLLIFLLAPLSLFAQVSIRVQAPSEVVDGDKFRVSYVVNTSDVENFKVEEFQDLVELYGPSQSTSSSFSIVNGKTTSSSSVTFTYTVTTSKPGTFRIPVATVVSGGKAYKSASPSITVLPGGSRSSAQSSHGGAGQGSQSSQGNSHSAQQTDRMRTQSAGEHITGKDIFIAVTASKKRVFEQEAVLLTYKLYTLVNVSEMTGKMPELDGFHVQELNRQRQPELKMEHYNGRNYGTVVWSQYVVFPQQTGTLTIPAIKFEATVMQQNRNIDPFEAFFGGVSMMQEVKKVVMAPAVTLQVDALPQPKPANFSGAVGHFTLSTSLTPQELKANDATTLRATLRGTGNMKLMKAPTPQWPKDFESYDPKSEDNTKIGATGSSGYVVYDYIAVPRHQGKYEVPALEFCYFDPDAREYKTLHGDAYSLEVERGKGAPSVSSAVSKEDVELLNSDIRYIKGGAPRYQRTDTTFFGSSTYWLIHAALLALFLVIVAIFRRQAAAGADLARSRGRKASKASTKRLKVARKLMQKQEANAFYEETMRALWGYIGDKLNIPVSQLTKDNVRQRLEKRSIPNELTEQFIQALDECEFARFAPGDPADTMDKVYASAEEVINKMEKLKL